MYKFEIALASVVLGPLYFVLFLVEILIWIIKILIGLYSFSSKNHFVNQYVYHQILATDQSVNSYMAGDINETVSSRAGRLWPNSWWCKLINFIVFWQKDHCQTHIEAFAGKADLIDPDSTKLV